ncbi:MAG: hypothetical protein HY914_09160 [Desulfomonile tiedjei]|nr:hypothetical protein [Desulfomonile tiedjei]
MRNTPYIAAVSLWSVLLLIFLAFPAVAAGPSDERPTYAQAQPMAGQPGGSGPPTQATAAPGVADATVVGVDPPENCLRIRRGPSSAYEVVGCAKLGDKVRLTGVFSGDNRWAQLTDNGWVFSCQIKTDFKPAGPRVACGRSEPTIEIQERPWRRPATSSEVVVPGPYFGGPIRGHFRYWEHKFHKHHKK